MRRLVFEEGMAVRLPHWTHCVVEVVDVGGKSFWGVLIDIKANEVVNAEAVFPLDDDWQAVLDSKTLKDL